MVGHSMVPIIIGRNKKEFIFRFRSEASPFEHQLKWPSLVSICHKVCAIKLFERDDRQLKSFSLKTLLLPWSVTLQQMRRSDRTWSSASSDWRKFSPKRRLSRAPIKFRAAAKSSSKPVTFQVVNKLIFFIKLSSQHGRTVQLNISRAWTSKVASFQYSMAFECFCGAKIRKFTATYKLFTIAGSGAHCLSSLSRAILAQARWRGQFFFNLNSLIRANFNSRAALKENLRFSWLVK